MGPGKPETFNPKAQHEIHTKSVELINPKPGYVEGRTECVLRGYPVGPHSFGFRGGKGKREQEREREGKSQRVRQRREREREKERERERQAERERERGRQVGTEGEVREVRDRARDGQGLIDFWFPNHNYIFEASGVLGF